MNTLFALHSPIARAIERLKTFEPPEGYYLAFSGGKDSQAILQLAIEAGVKYDAHFHLTTVDPPELLAFIRRYYPSVPIEKPSITMWRLIEKKLMPPTRFVRYCCSSLKENGGKDRTVITGIRAQESQKRSRRKILEACGKSGKTVVNPIIDWTEFEVWDFLQDRGLPHCKLYDQGRTRIGCIMCPMAGKEAMTRDAAKWPQYRKAYLTAFDKMLAARRGRGLPTEWNSAEEVMTWWINGYSQDPTPIEKSLLFFDHDLGMTA